jgi:hypothetical protein
METENKTAIRKPSWIRRILIGLLIVFIGMQFIQPDKDNQSMDMTNDISKVVTVPDSIHAILKASCYDCHSNFTQYPWYSNIQPVGWWLKDHIDEGKQSLNFSEFAALKPRPGGRYSTAQALQDHKLEEVAEVVEEGDMPLQSYTIIHTEAKLNATQKEALVQWVKAARNQLTGGKGSSSNEPAAEKKDAD